MPGIIIIDRKDLGLAAATGAAVTEDSTTKQQAQAQGILADTRPLVTLHASCEYLQCVAVDEAKPGRHKAICHPQYAAIGPTITTGDPVERPKGFK